jgi:hypothetical protein
MILKFLKYLESYLHSNHTPLYHFTTSFVLNEILRSNTLNVGYYKNPIKDEFNYFVSLTRNKFFKNVRKSNIRIELDKNKLRNNYKLIPYDYFIHSNIEIYPKSNMKRKNNFEFEEIIIQNIENVHLYILSINFDDIESYFKSRYDILFFQEKHNISFDITIKEQKIIINNV